MTSPTASPRRARTPSVLLVNGAKRDYAEALEGAGFRVRTVGNVRDALATRRRPDLVILELLVPDAELGGLAQAMKTGRRTRAMTVIALTGPDHEETVVKAGATFCRHPCPPDELVHLVRRTLEAPTA